MPSLSGIVAYAHEHLNFYRLHLLAFTLIPLISSGVFYASNGEFHIKYIDALFNSVSAMTVCGLATIDLSSLTPWQQVILFMQMCLGSPVLISWITVYVRRHFFAKKFESAIRARLDEEREADPATWSTRVSTAAPPKPKLARSPPSAGPLRPDMIRRAGAPPRPINPSGHFSPDAQPTTPAEDAVPPLCASPAAEPALLSEKMAALARPRTAHAGERQPGHSVPRTQTIEFARLDEPRRSANAPRGVAVTRTMTEDRHSRRGSTHAPSERRTQHRDFGGFPLPHVLAGRVLARLFPRAKHALVRSVTIEHAPGLGARYLSFDAVVGANSAFPLLSNEQLEELGGVEYRALNALLWIVAGYHIGSQLICYIIIGPYMSRAKWKADFTPPALHRVVAPAWYGLFQVVSAYTNTGMSLVDQSMTPFQDAFGLIFPIIFLVLAGNTAFPVFLRFTIWVISGLVPRTSRLNETLHFLLDHPRRCFLYLFPSHQTWFLLTVLAVLNCTDWFFFLVLDIGNSAIVTIPLGTRFAIGLLQAVAVRAAGFGALSLSALAPAVKVLYVLMMYVSVYPIAMSVRSTNVYEEQSLGVFYDKPEDHVDDEFTPVGPRSIVWGRYLASHARKQLSFDMWWLGLALFLVCIIERDSLTDESKMSYFNIFNLIFELVSAYGSVGLSLGLPNANYSFSGAFRPLSKLIMCVVMLRGRHRGLPVAIDRAVMLPAEFRKDDQELTPEDEDASGVPRTRTRHSTAHGHDGPAEKHTG